MTNVARRRDARVLLREHRDALLELFDLLKALALLLRALGRDVRAGEAQEVLEVLSQLAGEAPHGFRDSARVEWARVVDRADPRR